MSVTDMQIVATSVIAKGEEYFVARRSLDEEICPGLWTVPGGKLHDEDWASRPRDTTECWYGVLERLVEREVYEECGLVIDRHRFVASMVLDRGPTKSPAFVVSLGSDYKSGLVKLNGELIDFAWTTVQGLYRFNFIEGIADEIRHFDGLRYKRILV